MANTCTTLLWFRIRGIFVAGLIVIHAQAVIAAVPPANRVYDLAHPWEEKFSQKDYVPASPLEKALYEYFQHLSTELIQASVGDTVDFARISGQARRDLAPETENLISLFMIEGYTRTETEQYFQTLYVRVQRDMALYFGRKIESARPRVKPADATTSDEQLDKAEKFFRARDPVGALKALENALRFAPDNVRSILETAIRQQGVGQLAEARENFDQARALYPHLTALYGMMGEVRASTGDYYGAINDFNVALGLQPDNIPIYSARGQTRIHLGDYEGAIDDFGLHIATGLPWRLEYAYLGRSMAYYRLGNLELTRHDVESALRVAPKCAEAYGALASLQQRQGEYEQALKSANRFLELRPGNTGVLALRTWAYYGLDKPELALADARLLADEDPNAGMTLAVLLDALDQLHQAETQYHKTIDQAQRKEDNDRWRYANYQMDMMLRRVGRFEQDYLKDVLTWTDEWSKRIGLYLAGQIDGASLLKAAQQEPNREKRRNQVCEANYYHGMVLWTGGKKAEAIPFLETAALPEYSGNFEFTLARKILGKTSEPKLQKHSLAVQP